MNDFKELKENYLKYDLKYFTISSIISTILITIFYNLNIDFYLKSFIIPTLIVLITYIVNIKHNKLEKNKISYYLLIPIMLIILNSFIFKVDFSNKFLNILILPIIITCLLLYLLNKNFKFKIKTFIIFIEDTLNNLFPNLNNINKLFKEKSKNKNIIQIIIGLLIGIPICIILLSLLSSADMYFNYFIGSILDKVLDLLNIEFIWKNIFVISISFILTFSIFINYMLKRDIDVTKTKLLNISSSSISTILILINLVYLLFLFVEISKLTTNFLHLPALYTYSEYAREGFFQLLFITCINFIITLFILYKTNLENNKIIKTLLLILISLSIVLIFNSYYRMILYISAYTFTILRLQVILFLFLELILFILLIKKIVKDLKHNNFKLFSIIALIIYIINLYLCNDIVIDFINKLITK